MGSSCTKNNGVAPHSDAEEQHTTTILVMHCELESEDNHHIHSDHPHGKYPLTSPADTVPGAFLSITGAIADDVQLCSQLSSVSEGATSTTIEQLDEEDVSHHSKVATKEVSRKSETPLQHPLTPLLSQPTQGCMGHQQTTSSSKHDMMGSFYVLPPALSSNEEEVAPAPAATAATNSRVELSHSGSGSMFQLLEEQAELRNDALFRDF